MITIKKSYRNFFQKYKHAVPLLIYFVIYTAWFSCLEQTIKHYKIIHVALDDYIPFCEVFVIPYYLWFAYVAVTIAYFFFKDKDEYFKCCIFLFIGMTIFLFVSTIFPNGHRLRPYSMPRNNIFTQLVALLYKADTPTNICPSIHVYNSLGCHIAIAKSRHFEKHKGIRLASLILCVSIILSTMFIKQHSAFDVITACMIAAVTYLFVYRFDAILNWKHSFRKVRHNVVR